MSDEMIVRHCSPTLAGLKTGNLFTCSYESKEQLRNDIRSLNRRLSAKGLCILPLRIRKNNALIYVYRPSKLEKDLAHDDALPLLKNHGYMCDKPVKCIAHLICRLRDFSDFPHEIGLFLGYPPEDVKGFIENNSKDFKFVGNWKVYGDEEKAKKLFARYKKCTDTYIQQLTKGKSIERLTVAV